MAAADDLVQDCLERALRKHRLWTRRGSIRSWLFKMLYHVHIDHARRARRALSLEGEEIEVPAQPTQEGRVYCLNVAEALKRLPDDQRATILMIALGGMSYDVAADTLGVPVGTVRSRLSRGREALRAVGIGLDRPVRLQRLK
jgi:RNA polymerase sigma-70 factor (ECF subfamily)